MVRNATFSSLLVAPWFGFHLPRLPYPVATDEIIVTNGSLSAALVSNGDSSYLPSQLRRILAPPFLLNNQDAGTFVVWGFDDQGYHAVTNEEFDVDYSVKGVKARTSNVQWEGQTNSHWHTSFEYRTLPLSRVLLARVRYQNTSNAPHPLRLALNLINPQITREGHWDWWNPGTGAVSAHYAPDLGNGAVLTSSAAGDAYLVFGLDAKPDSHAVTTANEWGLWREQGRFSSAQSVDFAGAHSQYLARDFGVVAPGATVSVTAFISIAGSEASAKEEYLQSVQALPERLQAADAYWDARRQATKFSVLSPDANLNRMSEVALANGMSAWDELNNSWVTAFSENARGCNYLWDNGYAGYGFLFSNPARVKDTLRQLLSLDWHTSYAYSIPSRESVGVYYSYNHATLIELIYKYVTMSGDLAFLHEKINNTSVLDILIANVNYVQDNLGYNFGGVANLLEVVPRYVHEIPDLVAATAKMAQEVRALADAAGRTDALSAMDLAAASAKAKTQSLWDPANQWFRTGDGTLVYTAQVFNMIYSGVLTPEQISGVLLRKDDFIFPYGIRSLAAYDPDYRDPSVARGDWDGPGSYIGNTGNMLRALGAAGRAQELYDLATGISQWFQWRPWQPQGIEASTGKGIGSISENTTNTAASRYLEVVPFDMLGLSYTMNGISVRPVLPPVWTNTSGLAQFRGHRYALRVDIPYLGYRYTFYADKPNSGTAVYSSASLYDSHGKHLQDLTAALIPPLKQDLTVVLHCK